MTNASKQPNNFCTLIVLALALAGVMCPTLSIAQGATNPPSGPTVTTDREDYPPYSVVYITGTGFRPSEIVSNRVVEIAGSSPGTAYDPWEFPADTNGNFNTVWYIFTADFIGATFELTTVGLSSGLKAQTRFSDAAFNAQLQGLSFGSTDWSSGNVTNWQELDLITLRVYLTSIALTAGSNQTITVSFDHTKTTGNSIIPGFENLYN